MYQPEENQHKSPKTDALPLGEAARRDADVDKLPPLPAPEDQLTEPVGRVTRRDGGEAATERPE